MNPRSNITISLIKLLQFTVPVLGCVLLFAGAGFFYFVPHLRNGLMDQKRQLCQRQAETAHSLIAAFHRRVLAGDLTEAEGKRRAADIIRELRFGPENKGYFWINDLDLTMVAHPYRLDLEGTDVSGHTDPNGKLVFKEFGEIAKRDGGGFSDNIWQWNDVDAKLAPELSYVKGFEPWRWVIGTGIHVEDVRAEISRLTRNLMQGTVLITVLVLLLGSYLSYQAARSERKRLQVAEELHASERLMASIVDFLPDATLVVDADRRVIAWNRAMAELTGTPASHMLHTVGPRYTIPFLGREGTILLDSVFGGEPHPEHSYAYLTVHGDRLEAEGYSEALGRHLLISAGPLRDEDGALTGAIETIRDITDHREAESEQRQLREQLNQSQRMEAVGRLAGGVAHDFNNLLTPIIGYADVLRSIAVDDVARDGLERILQEASRARELTSQLLAFCRRQPMARAPMSLNRVVWDAHAILVGLLRDDVRLVMDLTPDLPKVMADTSQIEQVLINLVVNAHEAMPRGGDLVIRTRTQTVSTEETGEAGAVISPGCYAVLEVQDAGEGMDSDTRAQIFEPFFTTKERGAGLGLATTYGIVRQHGGHVFVESTRGTGTTFTVLLPEQLVAEAAPENGRVTPTATRQGTILVVEDNAAVRDLAVFALNHCGYDAVAAASAEHALRMFRSHRSDIVLLLLDVIMPDATGPEVYERLARERPGLPVLYMSGHAGDEMTSRGIDVSTVPFLAKPFTLSQLSRAVDRSLRHTAPEA